MCALHPSPASARHVSWEPGAVRPSAYGRGARAFSMLELLIAGVILGVGLILVAGIFPVALDQHRQSSQQIFGTELALSAKRLVQSHLVPHVDTGRNFRGVMDLGYHDDDGDTQRDDPQESTPRGPIRWDPPAILVGGGAVQTRFQVGGGGGRPRGGRGGGSRRVEPPTLGQPVLRSEPGPSVWFLTHFETIFDDGRVEPWTHPETNRTYADILNGDPRPARRPAWVRLEDMVMPPVRRLANADATGALRIETGAGRRAQLATPSYVWHLLYQRPSSDPRATDLAYRVTVCRFAAGETFALQNVTDDPMPATAPLPLEAGPYSLMPVPWLIAVRRPGSSGSPGGGSGRGGRLRIAAAEVSASTDGILSESDGRGNGRWRNEGVVTLSQLAPRGTRLFGQQSGTVYTVLQSPAFDAGSPDPHRISVLPSPSTVTPPDSAVWIFPPSVDRDRDDQIAGWRSRSPVVTSLRF